jgi:hypothetical protein
MSSSPAPVPRSSGGLLTRIAYTSDSKFLLCCSGYVIKLFSTVTGAQVRTLVGHTAEVTAVVQHPTLELQAFSASVDGRILLWDLDEAKVLRVVCVGLPILAMALDAAQPEPTAIVLTGGGGSEAPPSDVPVYCQGLVHAGRVYSVGLGRKAIESQTDWAASYLARPAAARPPAEGDGGGGPLRDEQRRRRRGDEHQFRLRCAPVARGGHLPLQGAWRDGARRRQVRRRIVGGRRAVRQDAPAA